MFKTAQASAQLLKAKAAGSKAGRAKLTPAARSSKPALASSLADATDEEEPPPPRRQRTSLARSPRVVPAGSSLASVSEMESLATPGAAPAAARMAVSTAEKEAHEALNRLHIDGSLLDSRLLDIGSDLPKLGAMPSWDISSSTQACPLALDVRQALAAQLGIALSPQTLATATDVDEGKGMLLLSVEQLLSAAAAAADGEAEMEVDDDAAEERRPLAMAPSYTDSDVSADFRFAAGPDCKRTSKSQPSQLSEKYGTHSQRRSSLRPAAGVAR